MPVSATARHQPTEVAQQIHYCLSGSPHCFSSAGLFHPLKILIYVQNLQILLPTTYKKGKVEVFEGIARSRLQSLKHRREFSRLYQKP